MSAAGSDDAVLRRKYLDWCSARIADSFLQLTPEEIYRLAYGEDASDGGDEGSWAEGSANEAAESRLSYRELVGRVTERLAMRMQLPPYELWAQEYRAGPEKFEAELLGFWRPEEEESEAGLEDGDVG